jgi:hypothetical protein
MPAFTQLCEKFNFSLFDDAITIYPKDSGKRQMRMFTDGFSIFAKEMECNKFLIESKLNANDIDAERFVYRTDVDHDRYHQDGFVWDDTHYHAKFDARITEEKLEQVLGVFAKYGLINANEKRQFQDAFAHANVKTPEEQAFYAQLAIIDAKAFELEEKAKTDEKYIPSANQARELHGKLSDAMYSYKLNQNANSYQTFKRTCEDAIQTAKPELEKHRQGWKKILGNVGLAVAGLGIGYLVAGLINLKINQQFTFFNKTDSIDKVEGLEKAFNAIPVSA